MKPVVTTKVSRLAVILCGVALPACIGLASVSEENAYAIANGGSNGGDGTTDVGDTGDTADPGGTDTLMSTEDCRNIPWGSSCSEGSRIYNVTFNGIATNTMEEKEISLADIRCDGFDSVLLFSGDTS